jgi:hypothetical protein
VIIKDLGDSLFSILIDESCDISIKEQMAVVLRYVDNSGHIIELFLAFNMCEIQLLVHSKQLLKLCFLNMG